jgi:hypothetical protein
LTNYESVTKCDPVTKVDKTVTILHNEPNI